MHHTSPPAPRFVLRNAANQTYLQPCGTWHKHPWNAALYSNATSAAQAWAVWCAKSDTLAACWVEVVPVQLVSGEPAARYRMEAVPS